MREIKFREYILFDTIGVYRKEWEEIRHETMGTLFDTCHNNIVQYTGLKDKNGVEVYEGDIVQYNNRLRVIEYTGLELSCGQGYGTGYALDDGDGEVVGNIYENKELLNDQT